MSIATAILEQVQAAAAQHALRVVSEVQLRVGELRLIVPEALQMAWEAATEGTLAQGAALTVQEVAARVRCRRCANEFRPEWPVFVCERCSQATVEVLAGEELVLDNITGERA